MTEYLIVVEKNMREAIEFHVEGLRLERDEVTLPV